MAYQQMIQEALSKSGQTVEYDPRHIEAWMRSEHGTLDALSRQQFNAEVRVAVACIDAAGVEMSERLAQSEGL